MRKSWLMVGLVVLLVLGTALGCAAPKPVAPPAPAPAPAPTPTPAAPKVHEPVEIEVLGAGAGGRGYTMAHVVADVLNKYGPEWLHATGSTTRGHVENILITYKDPERRAKTLVYTADYCIAAAALPRWAFKEKITGLKPISITHVGAQFFATLDPKITKFSDLAGKKVSSDRAGSTTQAYYSDIFQQAGFPIEEVQLSRAAAKDALIAGTIAAMPCQPCYTGDPEVGFQSPIIELLARKKEAIHFFSMPRDVVEKAAKATGIPYTYSEFAAGALMPGQTEPVGGMTSCNEWGVWPEFPDEVVYEILKTLYENAETYRAYHVACRGLSKETIAWVNVTSLDEVHPAALKFYQEKGIEVGMPQELPKYTP